MKKTRKQANSQHSIDLNILDAKGAQSGTFTFSESHAMNREERRSYEKEKKRQDKLLARKS